MDSPKIPVHILPEDEGSSLRLDHILPAAEDVSNEVHRHDFHELFFFEKGSGEHMIDLEQHPVSAPSLHLVAPGQVHQLSRSANTKGTVVMFPSDLDLGFGNPSKAGLFGPDTETTSSLNKDQLSEAKQLLSLMEHELKLGEHLLAMSLLVTLIMKSAKWMSSSPSSDSSTEFDAVRSFQELVAKHFKYERKVGAYADMLNLSPGHLNELCNKRLGKSASAIVQERTVLEAKRLLLHSTSSIKEISYSLNIEDPAYFTRMFKRATGQSPNLYRKQIREKYK